jgi:hypothetical protein
MRPSFASAVLLALTLAPAAYAQVSCSDVSRLNAEALDDFDEIAGDEIDDDFYESTFRLGGAEECSVSYDWDSIHSCLWIYRDYASAIAAFNAQNSAVSRCLTGWGARSSGAETAARGGHRTLAVNYYEGSGTYVDVEWAVVLEEHTDSTGLHYDVYVETAYLL